MGPGNCNTFTTAVFNGDKIASILGTMKADWPSLTSTDFASFW